MTALLPSVSAWKNLLRTIGLNKRVRLLIALLALLSVASWYWYVRSSAVLTVAGHHGFKRGELSIWVDGDLKATSEISGVPKKKLGVFQKTEGTFSKSVRVSTGEHSVRVRFRSLTDGYDVTRQVQISARAGAESTVYVNADRGPLALSFASPSSAPRNEPDSSPAYGKTLQSLLMAIGGSVLSASVGFVVQDFLRSRKAAIQTKASS